MSPKHIFPIAQWRRTRGRGFTLVELMVTLSILAIVLAIAAPSLGDVTLGNRLTAYANNLIASTVFARGEAIKRNATVKLCASSDGATCATAGGWEQGWIVQDADDVVLQRQPAATGGIKISEAANSLLLSFKPTGVGATAATLTICRAVPSAGSQERVVRVSATGRASVSKTSNAACS